MMHSARLTRESLNLHELTSRHFDEPESKHCDIKARRFIPSACSTAEGSSLDDACSSVNSISICSDACSDTSSDAGSLIDFPCPLEPEKPSTPKKSQNDLRDSDIDGVRARLFVSLLEAKQEKIKILREHHRVLIKKIYPSLDMPIDQMEASISKASLGFIEFCFPSKDKTAQNALILAAKDREILKLQDATDRLKMRAGLSLPIKKAQRSVFGKKIRFDLNKYYEHNELFSVSNANSERCSEDSVCSQDEAAEAGFFGEWVSSWCNFSSDVEKAFSFDVEKAFTFDMEQAFASMNMGYSSSEPATPELVEEVLHEESLSSIATQFSSTSVPIIRCSISGKEISHMYKQYACARL